jgi:hypothetical protein
MNQLNRKATAMKKAFFITTGLALSLISFSGAKVRVLTNHHPIISFSGS